MKSRVAAILRILRQCQGHQHQHPTLTLQLGQGITLEMHSGQLCWIHLPGKPCLSGLNFSFSCKIQALGISKHAWFSSISCRQKQRWLLWRCRRAPRSIPARRRRVLSNYSALSLYNGNKGKTKPHDASNTREQFESSLGTGFYGSLSLNPRLATSNCFWQIGRRRGIKDDCFNLQLKRGKIWTDRE